MHLFSHIWPFISSDRREAVGFLQGQLAEFYNVQSWIILFATHLFRFFLLNAKQNLPVFVLFYISTRCQQQHIILNTSASSCSVPSWAETTLGPHCIIQQLNSWKLFVAFKEVLSADQNLDSGYWLRMQSPFKCSSGHKHILSVLLHGSA